jgi:hypothetical protein
MKKTTCLVLFIGVFTLAAFSQEKLGMMEYLYNTTVKIQTIDSVVKKAGTSISYGSNGTGFFFTFETSKGSLPAIVTSRSIVNTAESLSFFFLESGETGIPIYSKQSMVTLKRSALPIFYHPDPSVDLAIIPVNPIIEYLQKQKITISYHSLNESVIPTDSITNTFNPSEDLYVISSPQGLEQELNSLPIMSKGTTATPLFLDHFKKKEFLAEIAVYEGSTGAPVIAYQANNNTRYDEAMTGHRVLLVGILSGTYTKGFQQRIVLKGSYPKEQMIAHENMGVVIKAQRLLEFKKLLSALKK